MVTPLPIDSVVPEILRTLERSKALVLEAATGAGKTTRVPPALLPAVNGEVWVLEPRRIAARMAARRAAAEMGERVGETTGYQVRFDEVAGPSTRLRFITEGILTRKLLAQPRLDRVSLVVLDEFHERHLDGDVGLAILKRLQSTTRPDLKLLVMSATLDTSAISKYLGDCPVLRSEGRLFPVETTYAGYSADALEVQVVQAVESLLADGRPGHILVFLPGAAEIRRAMRACEAAARAFDAQVFALHGELPPEDQDAAVAPSERRKIVLATNVAESSITIDGVTAVIDSGLARIATDSIATGLPTLELRRISKASAAQRAGRAGRTSAGRVIRLYSVEDYARRAEFETPEILRRELSQVVLELTSLGLEDVPWLDAPPQEALAAARELLGRLRAFDNPNEFTRFPVHPRLARLLIEATKRGVANEGCRAAALMNSGDRFDSLDAELSFGARQMEERLRRVVGVRHPSTGTEEDLQMAVLAAYPDRVGRRRSSGMAMLCTGQPIALQQADGSEFFVAINIEDRRDGRLPLLRAMSPIRPDWLLDLFPERVRAISELVWNREARRVEQVSALRYDELSIDESVQRPRDNEDATRMLVDKALEQGVERIVDGDQLKQLRARIAFASSHSTMIRAITDDDIRDALFELAHGLVSMKELEATAGSSLLAAVRLRLGAGEQVLDELAPERITVKHRNLRVNYVEGQQPWIASRLQDFFGIQETPRVARGRVAVLVHLLAPNQRPVQVTADLAGFWERLYPQVRRELSRRYPKHAWPESPV